MITQDDFEKSVLGYLSKSDPLNPETIYRTVFYMIQIQDVEGVRDSLAYTVSLCEKLPRKLFGFRE